MEDTRLRALIQEMIDTQQKKDLYGVAKVPFHTHNGIDSPTLQPTTVTTTTIAYSGYINNDGTSTNVPTGWTSVKNSTGNYTITHNLGITTYNVVATSAGGAERTMANYGQTSTTFTINALNVGAGPSNIDTDFTFVLVLYS